MPRSPSGVAELARRVKPCPARTSQPSTQADSRPGHPAAAACSSARISETRIGRAAIGLSATTEVGDTWTTRPSAVRTATTGSTETSSPMTSVIGWL
uniref:hypothetical protein n=1 Tax=Rhodococcus rhodochrous TaxID=1829 RepID=UPI00119D2DDE